jgi:CRISPR-associated endonuclease Cas2
MENEIRTIFILMYDITHPKTLQKVARLLEQHGYERINYSVWTGARDPAKVAVLGKSLKTLMENPKAERSKLFCLPLTLKDFEKMKSYNGDEIENMQYWTGRKATEFF